MNLQKILVAIDFSPDSERALDAALELARGNDSKVTLLNVCELPPYSAPGLSMYVPSPELLGDIVHAARRSLDEQKARCAAQGIAVDVACVTGTGAANEIVAYATANDFDLIVVGSHGRRGFRRWMLGSVAEAGVRTADRPVLTVRRPDVAAATAGAA